jgi:hypothetical protein
VTYRIVIGFEDGVEDGVGMSTWRRGLSYTFSACALSMAPILCAAKIQTLEVRCRNSSVMSQF